VPRIAVFFDGYTPMHAHKDPGQIVLGLRDLGTDAFLITYPKPELKGEAGIPTLIAGRTEVWETRFWRELGLSAAVLYTWLSPRYLGIQRALYEAGIPVILKGDTDGRIAAPLRPRDLSVVPGALRRYPRWIARWLRTLLLGARAIGGAARAVELADAAIVESPAAAANISYLFWIYRRLDLARKIRQIPNPVHPRFVETPVGRKDKLVVSVGRWEDMRQKNTASMVRALARFLSVRMDHEGVIVGSGERLVQRLLDKEGEVRAEGRLHVLGAVGNAELPGLLSRARIFLLPSRWEGFPIAAAEAVAMGCSVVGTLLEALLYLTGGGAFGTVAPSFSHEAIASALLYDAQRWDGGYYQPEAIAEYWRARLDRKAVGRQLLSLVEQIRGAELGRMSIGGSGAT